MNWIINLLAKTRLLKGDLDLHLVRASMVQFAFVDEDYTNPRIRGLNHCIGFLSQEARGVMLDGSLALKA
jgi:hypothetical protein